MKVLAEMAKGHNVLAHCRGGIGRAGLLACCVVTCLKSPSELKKPKDVIALVRSERDRRCVESRKQEDFVAKYFAFSIAKGKE